MCLHPYVSEDLALKDITKGKTIAVKKYYLAQVLP